MPGAETDIATIVASLKHARGQQQRMVLFLGSRAGGLFGNEDLYGILKDFSLRSFNELSPINKFAECYNILRSGHFSTTEIHHILVGALRPLHSREEDKILDVLVRRGLFEAIITTNIDTLLEDAFMSWGMREAYNYQVIINGLDSIKEFYTVNPEFIDIIKTFGDLSARSYNTPENPLKLEEDKAFKQFLAAKLAKDVLVIGYDPVWDWPLEHAFPEKGGTIWYVNEKPLPPDTRLSHVLNRRRSKLLIGSQGNYGSFLRALYYFLDEDISQKEVANTQFPLLPQPQNQVRKKVIISHSHKDEKYPERLKIHLSGYLGSKGDEDLVDIWDDTEISSSTNWEEEIKESLKSAKVAVVLVSADFLASEFIRDHELPILLEEKRKGEIELLSVILDPSFEVPVPSPDIPYQKIVTASQLYEYSVVNSDAEPLKRMSLYGQEVVWDKLAEQIYNLLIS